MGLPIGLKLSSHFSSFGSPLLLGILLNILNHYYSIKLMTTLTKNRRLIVILAAVPTLLMIPLIAMQFSDEVNWSSLDFLVMGGLLLAVGLSFELVMRKVRTLNNRLALLAIILIVFLLVWVELAVGIFGTPFAGT